MSHAQTNQQSLGDSFFLSNEALLAILEDGREVLETKGSLLSVLFIELNNGKCSMSPVKMPGNSELKYRMFHAIGKAIRSQKGAIKDAVLLCETWIVNAQEAPDATKYMPSQHPCRYEAIMIIGRNADKTRSVSVIQKFTRDEHNAPVWSEPEITMADSFTKGVVAKGLLDALFDD